MINGASKLLRFLFPSNCLHCHCLMGTLAPLCVSCFQLLEPLHNQSRCKACFQTSLNPLCMRCRNSNTHNHTVAAVFEYDGPMKSLITGFKYQNKKYLSDLLGSYLAFFWSNQDWTTPDIIVPVPMSPIKKCFRGYNQAELLAKTLSVHINVPCIYALGKYPGAPTQAFLSQNERMSLSSDYFFLNSSVKDLKVLLIDDVMTTGATIQACFTKLSADHPREMHALTLAMVCVTH